MAMEYTEEQLNNFDKATLVQLFLVQQSQLKDIDQKLQLLLEQVAVLNNNRFGRSSEKLEDSNQIRFMEVDGEIIYFNEAEAVASLSDYEEDEEPPKARGKKTKGSRMMDIQNLPVVPVEHKMTEEQLIEEFGEDGWYQLEDEIINRYRFTPMKVEIEEHHVGVYKSKKDNRFIKASHPGYLLRNSLVSPSLLAGIWNAKYVNAVPLYRQEQEFKRMGTGIDRADMAHWTILCAERYLSILYDYLHERIYEYQPGRNASHPREFLKEFNGICVTDGYQVYHTIEKEREDLKIAGCWAHARRRFDEAVKALPKAKQKDSLAYLALKQIQAIYREDSRLADMNPQERLKHRQVTVKPLVDAYFAWVKQNLAKVTPKSKTANGFTYAINQEEYLRVFLEDGDVPLDNNSAEQAIRPFCVGKKNWVMIDTIAGANASAIIYSIAETAKANNLKPYNYFEYLLTEIPKHMDDHDMSFCEDLLPWSEKLPAECRK